MSTWKMLSRTGYTQKTEEFDLTLLKVNLFIYCAIRTEKEAGSKAPN